MTLITTLDDAFYALRNQAGEMGLAIYSFVQEGGVWTVSIFDIERAFKFRGLKPEKRLMRDKEDYEMEIKNWYESGIVKIAKHENLQTAIKQAIRALSVYTPGDVS